MNAPEPSLHADRPGMDVPRHPRGKGRRRLAYVTTGVISVVALLAVARVGPAEPTVDRGSVIIAQVERGRLVVSSKAAGKLEPERMRFVAAVTAGRVEQVLVEAGALVEADTVLVRLSNPDVDLQWLQAQQQVGVIDALLGDTKRTLTLAQLTQESLMAATEADYGAAVREAEADARLAARQVIAEEQARRSAERARALSRRREIEDRGLAVLRSSEGTQTAILWEQRERLRQIAEHQRRRLESLIVRAGAAGVVQDLTLRPGEWVQPGTMLAHVVEPGRLRAELRVSQAQATSVGAGQRATVDVQDQAVSGRVTRVDPNVRDGFVSVEIEIEGELPAGARPDLAVDGVIIVAELDDVLHVERPAVAGAGSVASLFKVVGDGRLASRVRVSFGRASPTEIQVRQGLDAGDRVIVSDMSAWEQSDRVRLR
jgi:multidrug efflux pump subunit AcrA (membrane-fusion protein)